MAVDVSKIPNNSKFDPVREAILDLQTSIEETGAAIGNGTLTINTNLPLSGSGTFTANQITNTSISIGIDLSDYALAADYLPLTGGTLTGALFGTDLTLSGNLTVSGTTTFIDTTNLNIGDNIITLNADLPSGSAPTESAGIEINRGSAADVSFLWDEANDRWTLGSNNLIASSFIGDLIGNASTASTLETARNIAISGAVTGTASFDGSANITITTTVNHNHDDRYYTETESDNRFVNVTGDTMTGDLTFTDDAEGIVWSRNTDGASIKFYNTGDADTNSRLEFQTRDNNNEYFRWTHAPSGGTVYELMRLTGNGTGGNLEVSGTIQTSGATILGTLTANATTVKGILDVTTAGAALQIRGVEVIDADQNIIAASLDTDSISSSGTLNIDATTQINLRANGDLKAYVDATGFNVVGGLNLGGVDGISLTDEDSTIDSFFHANVNYDAGLYQVTSDARYGADYIQVDGNDTRTNTAFTIAPKELSTVNPRLYLGGNNSITAPNTLIDWQQIVLNAENVIQNVTSSSINGALFVSGNATANSFIKDGGTASQFLKADGSVDSNTYLTSFDITTQTDPKYLRSDINDNKSGYILFQNEGTATINTNYASYPLIFRTSGWDTNNSVARTVDWYIRAESTSSVYPEGDLLFYEEAPSFAHVKLRLYGRGSGSDYQDPDSARFYGNVYVDETTDSTGGNFTVVGSATANSFIKSGGTSSQFLKADGSVDTNTYLTAETDTLQSVTTRGASTTNAITIDNNFYIANTNDASKALYIMRNASTVESLRIHVDDGAAVFTSIQDENTTGFGSFIFNLDSGAPTPYFDIRYGASTVLRLRNNSSDSYINVPALGIGTTTPSEKLDVVGSVLAQGFKTQMIVDPVTYTGNVNQYFNSLQISTNVGGTIELGGSGSSSVQNNVTIPDGDLTVSGNIQSLSQIRAGGWYNTQTGNSGDLALEIGASSGEGYIISYNRNTTSYGNMNFAAVNFNFDERGGTTTIEGNEIWHAGNGGSGSGLDADTVDGYHATSFFIDGDTVVNMANNDGFVYDDANNIMKVKYDGTEYAIWTEANDGSGSGLDADTVDGIQGSEIWRKKTDIPNAADLNTYVSDGYYHQNSNSQAAAGSNYPVAQAGMLEVLSDGVMVYQKYTVYNTADLWMRSYYNGTWYSWGKQWDSSNAGSGSGLDADTVDGLQASQFLRSDADDTATGMITINTTGGGVLRLQNNDTSNAQNQTLGSIVWNNQDGSSTGPNNAAIIEAQTYGSLGQGANLLFKTVSATTEGGDATTSMTLFGDGVASFNNNVGIGDATPDAKLHITTTSGDHLRLAYNDSYYWDIAREAADGRLSFTDNVSGEALTISTSGNVGIGTTTTVSNPLITELHIDKPVTNGVSRIRLSSSVEGKEGIIGYSGYLGEDYMYFTTGNTNASSTKMVITDSGSVGIGTSTPESLLHVSSSTSGDAIVIIEADTDNNTEGDIPQLWFRADGGINESAIINNDNRLEFVNNVASGGGIAFLTGATNNYGLTAPATGASVKMIIETGGNVGIGTTSPVSALTVNGDILPSADNTGVVGNTEYTWADGQFTNLSVNSTLTVVSTLNVRAAIDLADSDILRFGSSDDFKMYYDGSANEMEFEMEASCNQIRIHDNGTTRFTLARSTGTFTATGDVVAFSDARVKENVETIENALDKILAMRGVSYNRTDQEDKSKKVGVIAQEIEKVLPEVVTQDGDGMKGVAYGNIVGVLIEAIKEQQKQIDELKAKING